MPAKTIECPEQYRPYLPWLLRFLRREIPLVPDLWSIEISASALRLHGDNRTGPIASTVSTIVLDPDLQKQIAAVLNGAPVRLGDHAMRIREPVVAVYLTSDAHQGRSIPVPEVTIELSGMPDPILYAIEATDTGLLLHLRFPLTGSTFTIAVQ